MLPTVTYSSIAAHFPQFVENLRATEKLTVTVGRHLSNQIRVSASLLERAPTSVQKLSVRNPAWGIRKFRRVQVSELVELLKSAPLTLIKSGRDEEQVSIVLWIETTDMPKMTSHALHQRAKDAFDRVLREDDPHVIQSLCVVLESLV